MASYHASGTITNQSLSASTARKVITTPSLSRIGYRIHNPNADAILVRECLKTETPTFTDMYTTLLRDFKVNAGGTQDVFLVGPDMDVWVCMDGTGTGSVTVRELF